MRNVAFLVLKWGFLIYVHVTLTQKDGEVKNAIFFLAHEPISFILLKSGKLSGNWEALIGGKTLARSKVPASQGLAAHVNEELQNDAECK